MPTDISAQVLGDDGAPDALLNLHPIRRITTLEVVRALISFLAGPNGGYMTGDVLNVAGGLAIYIAPSWLFRYL